MKKQYIAEYQHRYDPGHWRNAASGYYNQIGRRYCPTLEQAQAALSHAKRYFNGKPHTDTQVCGMIGISSHTDSETAHRMEIVKTRIRVREVTEWELVEEVNNG